MTTVDRFVAQAQVALAFFYGTGFLGAVGALIFWPKPMDSETRTILISMLGVLGTLATQQSAYFFARTRTRTTTGETDETTTTQTPDGITSTSRTTSTAGSGVQQPRDDTAPNV